MTAAPGNAAHVAGTGPPARQRDRVRSRSRGIRVSTCRSLPAPPRSSRTGGSPGIRPPACWPEPRPPGRTTTASASARPRNHHLRTRTCGHGPQTGSRASGSTASTPSPESWLYAVTPATSRLSSGGRKPSSIRSGHRPGPQPKSGSARSDPKLPDGSQTYISSLASVRLPLSESGRHLTAEYRKNGHHHADRHSSIGLVHMARFAWEG